MKAIVQDSYGDTDVLDLRDVDRPRIADDEVLVQVRAAGVDRGVWHLMTGLPYPLRMAGYGLRNPKNQIPGGDIAGIVTAVGRDVTRFEPGDAVFGFGTGGFAQYACASEHKLALLPDDLTFDQAAAVPTSGMTALQALRDRGRVQPGQHVLIVGASGGVGTYAVQLAKAFGAHVTGVCSAPKVNLVRSLGADDVVDYTHDDFADEDHRYDLILDIGGNRSLSDLRRALTPRGTLVIVGGESGGKWLGGTDRQIRALVLSWFVGQTLTTFVCSENHEDLIVLSDLVQAGKLTPTVERTYPLVDAPSAIRHLERGRARGKVVISV